jgi:D-serine deaminase-like pyridoxal phosphate-dependent protein
MPTLDDPYTPFAVVDRGRMDRNIARLHARLDAAGVPLRLHVKTSKSLDVAARVFPAGTGPVTVSTLAEAEYLADGGYTDVLYAVGIDPHKLPRVLALRRRGVDLAVLLDSVAQADAVAKASADAGDPIPALIEIDCDGHRGGIGHDDPVLPEIGRRLTDGGAALRGVLAHAGESYFAGTAEVRQAAAQHERDAVVRAADRLRQEGQPCPVVSIGSTPTAHAATDLTGVTEVRAGNYVFFDLVMAGIGVCDVDDLALSVVVTVIGHRPGTGRILTDGGWTATSRDRGTATQRTDQGYGLVTTLDGRILPDLLMTGASQEHGTLALRPGSTHALPDLPVGARVRILPNHACATAAQHREYHVIDGRPTTGTPVIQSTWNRHNGW